ncbi:MAG TPA: hypothetical protein VH087_00810 [Thermoanaerobaculia bacterium]|nr:hypothetical protein [Thermoanaerobaculia bacterium]
MSVIAATIHFVGIITFLPRPSTPTARNGADDAGVKMASTQTATTTPAAAARSGVLAVIPQDFPQPIAKHTAMIIYHASDYVGSTRWKSSLLHRDGLKYVTLNHGDVVTFDTGGATNPPVAFPALLPHHPARSKTLRLDLLAPYGPDDRSHATVVNLPVGTLSVCEDNHRSDTTITLNARRAFVIKVKSKSGTRTLRLKSGAEVSFANVPHDFAETLADDHKTTNHYLEYCVMAGLALDRAHCPPPSYLPSAPVCDWPGKDMLVAQAKSGQFTPKMAGSADCSNTQWP